MTANSWRILGLPVIVPLVLSAVGGDAQAGPARLEDAARDAIYACSMPPADTAVSKARELTAAGWDKNKMACGADIWFTLAEDAPQSPDTQVEALLAATRYIEEINTLVSLDGYGVHEGEWSARLRHATEHGKVLEARLATLAPDKATALAARGVYRLTWPFNLADTKTQLAESKAARQLLEKAVGLDPGVLDGNALWLLARLYYDTPEFAGGDPTKAMKLLAQAHQQSPHNPAVLRYSAYVYVQERDIGQARECLTELLRTEPAAGSLQLWADELKSGTELAGRLGDTTLAGQLAAKRDALLNAHPQLLRHLVPAINRHGGVDPFTGRD